MTDARAKTCDRPKTPKERRREIADTRALLVERFPKTFAPRREAKRPLKARITHELFEAVPDVSRVKLRTAVADYTAGPTYLRGIIIGAERIGLDGKPAGIVNADAEWHAKQQLARFERETIRAPMRALADALRRIIETADAAAMREIAAVALAAHTDGRST